MIVAGCSLRSLLDGLNRAGGERELDANPYDASQFGLESHRAIVGISSLSLTGRSLRGRAVREIKVT